MVSVLIVFIVIGIPVLGGLALGAYKEWLKHRGRFATTAEIKELKTQLTCLQAENQSLRQRLENLETIVVSEVWEKRGPATGASQPNIDIPKTLE